ncbi:MAG: response regulator transcription factor [Nitrospira sp.]|nr:response regulator transcription factor [Nitrospira sp.]
MRRLVLTGVIGMRQQDQAHRGTQESQKWIVHDPSRIRTSRARPIRVFIADGCEVIRAGVCALLEEERDLEVVGVAGNAEDVLPESQRTKPDVLILKSGLSGGLDFDIYKHLFNVLPAVRIISLMRDGDAEAFRNAVEGGAQGYLWEKAGRMELIRAIRTVATGDSYLGQGTVDQTFHLLRARQESVCSPSALQILSGQERRVMTLIVEGNTNKQIATKLMLSEKTVRNYVVGIFAKLRIRRRTQAVAIYMKAQEDRTPMRKEMSV